jgi:hypothetical protein
MDLLDSEGPWVYQGPSGRSKWKSQPKLSEKGLLTQDNCVVALIDHQAQMLLEERFGAWIQTKEARRFARRLRVPRRWTLRFGSILRKCNSPAKGQ